MWALERVGHEVPRVTPGRAAGAPARLVLARQVCQAPRVTLAAAAVTGDPTGPLAVLNSVSVHLLVPSGVCLLHSLERVRRANITTFSVEAAD
jgi:hypothetical protein